MEGYLVGRFVAALVQQQRCGVPVTAANLSATAYGSGGGFAVDELSVGPFVNNSCGQGLRQVWLANGTGNVSASFGGYRLLPQATLSFPLGSCNVSIAQLGPRALVFGQSAAFSGTSGFAGLELQAGILAAFAEQNLKDGVDGRMLRLVSLNDGYVASAAASNTKALVGMGVYGLIGYYGTTCSTAAFGMAVQASIPLIAPVTGTTGLRSPVSNTVVNVRASYTDEVYALVRYATLVRGLTRFSIFYQNDSLGMQGLSGLAAALSALSLSLLSNGSYPRDTIEVGPGLNALLTYAQPLTPEAVVVFAMSAPAVAFIRLAQTVLPPSTLYLCPSTVAVGTGFASSFASNASNVVVTQVTPLPSDTSYQATVEFQAAAGAMAPPLPPTPLSFEGYLGARLAIRVLHAAAQNQTLALGSFSSALLATSTFVIGGLLLGPYSYACNQGLRQVWYSSVANGQYVGIPTETFNFANSSCMSDNSTLAAGSSSFLRLLHVFSPAP